MPIFDQGYQHWKGELSGHTWRWWTITRQGYRAQLKGIWIRLFGIIALLPGALLMLVLVAWSLAEQKSPVIAPLLGFFDSPFFKTMFANPQEYRVMVWTICYMTFFQYQIFFSMILAMLIGPNLISQDLRFNAIPLYFSRPLRRIDYFLGKLGVIGIYVSTVLIVPALAAYALGVIISLDFSILRDTARVLLGIVGFGVIVVLSIGTLMLAFSALTRNSRFVGMLWLGMWLISGVSAAVLMDGLRERWCPLVSYTGNIMRMGEAMLDTETAWSKVGDLLDSMEKTVQSYPSRQPRPGAHGPAGAPQKTTGEQLKEQMTSKHPWYWSAGVLAGLFGLSVWILTSRVRTLDRLK